MSDNSPESKFAEIWTKFIPLRTSVRKAADDGVECDSSIQREWQETRNHIVAMYYKIVDGVAKTMAKKIREVEADALASLGVDGLYDAVDGFLLEEGVKFETYAAYRIRGAILDGLRREDWVPRLVRSRARKLAEKRDEMEARIGRAVNDEEMATELGISVDEYQNLISSSSIRQIQSLNTTYMSKSGESHNEEMPMIDCIHDPSTPEPVDIMIQQELTAKLFGKNFTPLERKIIFAYYYEGRSMKEIAGLVGLSESRVSQMNSAIMIRLREKVERNPDYFGKDVIARLKK